MSGKVKAGKIIRVINHEDKAIVQLEDGKKIRIKLGCLELNNEFEELDEFESEGFTQYDVQWDAKTINFKLKNDIGIFYGWWRKVSGEAYAIDLYCQFKGKTYNCDVLWYVEDPRKNIDSLNADICAATNKWFYYKCRGNYETIESLELKATKPIIHIESIKVIDQILLDLKDHRDSAIGSGGLYTYAFTGEEKDDPSMRIELNLSSQARGLKGRVPSLYTGAILDRTADLEKTSKKEMKNRQPEGNLHSGSIDSLLQKLKETKDKNQQRKLRAILRRMGHSGGARASKK